jgi:hypothetical protein
MNLFNSKSNVDVNHLIARDGWQCAYCRKFLRADMMTVDHVIPTLRGGPDTLANTVISCRECNARNGDMTAEEFELWYAVKYYVFHVAPSEPISFQSVEIVTPSGLKTRIALPALWMGIVDLPLNLIVLWETNGGIVIKCVEEYITHVVYLSGVLYDYYAMKRQEHTP